MKRKKEKMQIVKRMLVKRRGLNSFLKSMSIVMLMLISNTMFGTQNFIDNASIVKEANSGSSLNSDFSKDEVLEAPKDLSVEDTTFYWDNNPVVFYEDFDATSVFPEGWVVETTNTSISPDGLLCTWGINDYIYTTPVIEPYGSYYMNCGFDIFMPQNERSITPAIDIPENAFLTYNSAYWKGKSGFTVEISTNGGNSWFEVWNSFSTSGGMCPISNVEVIDLSSYANQTVNISFHTVQSMGVMGASWFIDNVCVTTDPNGGGKDFLNYTVFLDGAELGDTFNKEWPFENLTVGAHTAGVRSNYSEGSSEISELAFLYGLELNIPTNVVATVDENSATVTWESDGDYTSFNVYRDSILVAQDLTETTFVDNNLENGTYFYTVTNVYDFVESDMSDYSIAYIFVKPENWLWYNGPTITNPGEGSNRYDLSSLWGGLTGLGAGIQIANERVVADNFTVPEGKIWEIDSLQLYMCENAPFPTAALINDLRLLITNGDPSIPTTDTIWGDWETNVVSSASMTKTFRCKVGQSDNTMKQIQLVSVNFEELHLEAGEYWIQYSAEGDAYHAGPIQPYVTITDSVVDGNAKKHTPAGGWVDYIAGGATNIKEVPFEVVGREFYYPITNLTAEVFQDDVTLSWSAPVDDIPDSYSIYRDGVLVEDGVTNITYLDENLPNAVYNYCVEAIYGTDNADQVCVNAVVGYTPLSLPTNLSADVFELDVTLNWSAPEDMIPDSYEVYRDNELISTVAVLEYVDQMLEPGTYSYYLKAVYVDQTSEPTEPISVDVIMPDLDEPILLSATAQDDDVTLSWFPATMAGDFHQSFENEELPSDGWDLVSNSNKTWHRIEELIASATYFPTDGEYQMYLPWKNGFQDEWIISPEVALFENTTLTFDSHLFYGSTNGDHYYVKISFDNGATWEVLWDASALPAGQNFYQVPITIDLSDYAGKAVKLGWNGYGEQGLYHYWLLDNILLEGDGGKKDIAFDEMESKSKSPLNSPKSNITGYNVYRNGTSIAQNISDIIFLDENLEQGTYTYCVETVYNIGVSDQVCCSVELTYLPAVSFSTDLIEVEGSCDPMSVSSILTLENSGLADLVFTLSTETANGINWLSTDLTTGQSYTVDPNESMEISVICDASLLHNDLFNGDLKLETNVGEYNVDCSFDVDCDSYTLFPVSNIELDFDCSDVTISWDQPEGGSFDVLLYEVYRNTIFVGETTDLSLVDNDPIIGDNSYCIKAKYDYGFSELECNEITIETIAVPINLTASQENISSYEVQLSWQEPASNSEWIGYGDGINSNALGNTDPVIIFAAARWESDYMQAFVGGSISKISIYISSSSGAPVTSEVVLKVWTGTNGQTEVLSQPIEYTADTWNEIQLNQPVAIVDGEEYRVGYKCVVTAGEYPLGVDAGPAVAGFGDLVSADGITWGSLANDYNFDCNFNIKAFIQNDKKGVVQLLTKDQLPASDLSAISIQNSSNSKNKVFAPKAITGYKLYRNDEDITPASGISTTTYEDVVPNSGVYTYNVAALFGECESEFSNDAEIDITVGVENVDENSINISPNPVTDELHIESSYLIEKVVVYNSVGQIVDNYSVSDDYFKMNTTSYKSGLYLIQITVDGENLLRRVVVK